MAKERANLYLHKRHKEWADREGVNLSKTVRELLDERIDG